MADCEPVLPALEGNSNDAAVTRAPHRSTGVKVFILVMSGVIFTQNLVFAVEPATITTIQKEYGLTTFEVGVWFSCFEVGEILAGLFVTYFAGKSHKPRVLALNLIISAVCCLTHSLPHFIISDSTIDTVSNSTAGDLCRVPVQDACPNVTSPSGVPGTSDATTVLVIYCVASFFWGAAWGPTHGLSLVYIDDNMVDKSKSSLYMGVYYAMNYVGPIAGYGLAALTLVFPVDLHATTMKPSNANWIGAWWLGYVVSASIMAALAIPLLLFPRSLSHSGLPRCVACFRTKPEESHLLGDSPEADISTSNNHLTSTAAAEENGDEYKEELPTLRRLIPTVVLLAKSPLYVLIVISSATSTWVDGGYFSYLPKYLESQFHQMSSAADIESGISWSVVSTVATVAGGWLISHFRLNVRQCTVMVLCCFVAGTLLMASAMLFSCPQYPLQERVPIVSSCMCNGTAYDPVCLGGNSYYSPCYAGCRNVSMTSDGTVIEYLNCGADGISSATEDVCRSSCNSVYPFLVIVAFAYGIPVLAQMACITIILRSIRKEVRAFGIGIMCETSALIAWVPAPMVYGAAIDGVCTLWSADSVCSSSSDDGKGSCIEYDNDAFRYRLHLITDGALATSLLFALAACILAYRRHPVAEDPVIAVTEESPAVN